ncbi:hypothetical protein [Actinomadura formosensis]|nr:hypothetical protein [Actinomadura formosensis]
MKKGIRIGPGMIRLMAAMCVIGLIIVLVKETPAMRRYLKSESM